MRACRYCLRSGQRPCPPYPPPRPHRGRSIVAQHLQCWGWAAREFTPAEPGKVRPQGSIRVQPPACRPCARPSCHSLLLFDPNACYHTIPASPGACSLTTRFSRRRLHGSARRDSAPSAFPCQPLPSARSRLCGCHLCPRETATNPRESDTKPIPTRYQSDTNPIPIGYRLATQSRRFGAVPRSMGGTSDFLPTRPAPTSPPAAPARRRPPGPAGWAARRRAAGPSSPSRPPSPGTPRPRSSRRR